jgi:hypothetical protein
MTRSVVPSPSKSPLATTSPAPSSPSTLSPKNCACAVASDIVTSPENGPGISRATPMWS